MTGGVVAFEFGYKWGLPQDAVIGCSATTPGLAAGLSALFFGLPCLWSLSHAMP